MGVIRFCFGDGKFAMDELVKDVFFSDRAFMVACSKADGRSKAGDACSLAARLTKARLNQ